MSTRKLTEEKVFSYIREHHMLQSGDRVVAGISGGADSVCLLFVLLEWAKSNPLKLVVVHVNHGVRQEAVEDVAYVEELCRAQSIPFYLAQEDVPALAAREKLSEEEMGRRVRYEVFARVAQEVQANKIAVAHNSNDRSETMLFHLFRGSGIKGLSSIQPTRDDIIRPILCLERSEIEEYLRERGISYCQDATNSTDDYTRNRIRHHILPFVEEQIVQGCVQHMAQTAQLLSETEDYLEQQTAEAVKSCVERITAARACMMIRTPGAAGEVLQMLSEEAVEAQDKRIRETEIENMSDELAGWQIIVKAFQAQHPVIQKRILHTLIKSLSPHQRDISYVHIRDVQELFTRLGNREICLPFGIRARREYGKVIIEHVSAQNWMQNNISRHVCIDTEKDIINPGIPIHLPTHPSSEWTHKIFIGEHQAIVFSIQKMGNILKETKEVPSNQYTKWFDYDKIKGCITLRTRKIGDYLTISQGEGRMAHKSLKDYMIAQKIPRGQRDRMLLLADDSHVLWLLDHRISEYYKINKNTKCILQVQLIGEGLLESRTEEKNGRTC